MRIYLKRTGGFFGRSIQTEIDTASLPAAQAETIKQLVQEVDFQELPSEWPLAPGADRFTYQLTVVDEEEEVHTCYFSDEQTSAEMDLLLRQLTVLARRYRASGNDTDSPDVAP